MRSNAMVLNLANFTYIINTFIDQYLQSFVIKMCLRLKHSNDFLMHFISPLQT